MHRVYERALELTDSAHTTSLVQGSHKLFQYTPFSTLTLILISQGQRNGRVSIQGLAFVETMFFDSLRNFKRLNQNIII